MSDYIKREDAERLLRYYFLSALTEDERVDELNRIPSADVFEVVHAYDKDIYPSLFECSNCGWSCDDTYGGEPCNRNGDTYDYCPNCGARIEYKLKEQKHE